MGTGTVLWDKIRDATNFIQRRYEKKPRIAVVLGSGLGNLVSEIEQVAVIRYTEIPFFQEATVPGHAGLLIFGHLSGQQVVLMQGRFHYYEGYDIGDVVFPIQVLASLGVRNLLITNSAGGIDRRLLPGQFMILRDHINLMGSNPLRGANDERLGPRFPDMSDVYDMELRTMIKEQMRYLDIPIHEGVYAALSGPSYETPAEIRMLSRLGAHCVGMSTVPEALAARHMDMRVAGISFISNRGAGLSKTKLNHEAVLEISRIKQPLFVKLTRAIILAWPRDDDRGQGRTQPETDFL